MAEAGEVVEQATAAFNAHDRERMRALYADGVVLTAPADARAEGPEAATEHAMAWLRAFPDARISVHATFEGDGSVAQQFTFEGTHTETLAGPQGEIPATNRRLAGRGCEISRVEGGKIAEQHLCFDQMQLMTQLRLVPEPATAGAS